MSQPERIRWTDERRAKYALSIRISTPWTKAGVKSDLGKNIVRWNGLQTGRQSLAVLVICRLLHETKLLIKMIKKNHIA